MATAIELAPRLTEASRRKTWDVHTAFDWPEALVPDADWYMSPELISIYGTDAYEALDETQQKRLSFYEIVNFFSFVLYGERPLISGLMNRMYRKNTSRLRHPRRYGGYSISRISSFYIGRSGSQRDNETARSQKLYSAGRTPAGYETDH